jgi:hypothetical protein
MTTKTGHFSEQLAFDEQLRRIPDGKLGQLCKLMLERYAEPTLSKHLKARNRCKCGAIVKYHTGPRVTKQRPALCQNCWKQSLK